MFNDKIKNIMHVKLLNIFCYITMINNIIDNIQLTIKDLSNKNDTNKYDIINRLLGTLT